MSPINRLLGALCLLAMAQAGPAAHITDKLVVGLYPQPAPDGNPIKLLSSGTPIDVLQQRDGYTEVKLADETRGWVASTYVTEEKPAKAMLLETQAKLRQMGLELAALREKQSAQPEAMPSAEELPPGGHEAELQQALARAEDRVAELERQLGEDAPDAEARQELLALRERVRTAVELLAQGQMNRLADGQMDPPALTEAGSQRPLTRYRYWILGGVALLLGFVGGLAFADHRLRRRHGGFRI